MRFTSLSISNFLSYESQDLDLDGLDYVAIAGANGSGKSTIALAIAWALFGTARVKGDSDSVIRDEQDECAVTLEFEAEGAKWRVERGKKRGKPAKVRLFSQGGDGQWSPYGDHLNATAQARISDLVGMSEDAFFSLTIIDGRSGVRFINSDSTQRRDILLNLLPEMSIWGQMEEQARLQAKQARDSVEAEQTRLASDKDRIGETKEKIDEAEQEREALDPDTLRENLPRVERDIAALVKKIESAAQKEKDRLDQAQREHDTRERELRAQAQSAETVAENASRTAKSLRRLEQDVADAEQEVKDLEGDLGEAESEAASAKKKYQSLLEGDSDIDQLEVDARAESAAAAALRQRIAADEKSLRGLDQMQADHAAECPTCHTHLDDKTLANLIDRITAGIEQSKAQISAHEQKADALSAEADSRRKAIDEAQREATRMQQKVERMHDDKERAAADAQKYGARLEEALTEGGFDSVKQAREVAADAADAADALHDKVDEYVRNAKADIDALTREYERAVRDADEGKDGRALTALRDAKSDLTQKIRQADMLEGRAEGMRNLVRDLTESMRDREDSIRETVERAAALEEVVIACRPQGIPSMLLDGVLAPIESEATRILHAVPGGEGMMVRFEQARALKSRAGAKEVLDILVTMPTGVERAIESLSAGETVRVSMAVVFAMISVLGARRGGDALDTVFLDEPLGPLDQEAVPAFIEVLRSAISAGSLSSVMVVTHDQRVIEALPQRIMVDRADAGVSRAALVA